MFGGLALEYPGKLYEVDPALLRLLPRLLYFRKKVEFEELALLADVLLDTEVFCEIASSGEKGRTPEALLGEGDLESIAFMAS